MGFKYQMRDGDNAGQEATVDALKCIYLRDLAWSTAVEPAKTLLAVHLATQVIVVTVKSLLHSLVRHAQGLHNVEGEKNYKAYLNPEYLDAPLTQLGWQQVDCLRKHVHASGLSKRVELVVTSPLLRTLQTAVGVFGWESYMNGMNALPLMAANVGNSGRASISSLNSPPFIAVEDCREHFFIHFYASQELFELLVYILVTRDTMSASIKFFSQQLTFHWQIETDEDVLWKADIYLTCAMGPDHELVRLWTRKEKEIAIVTHSSFLVHTLSAFGNDCHPSVKKEMGTRFANCELRSMVIVDRSMIGSDVSTTNYPGKIPSGLDCLAEEEAPVSI
ncbi:hypothetical protein DKX38_024950 [Salix brachista]|uniref:Uncharacterized protein n=1 Tax=Salix brachista TaxID=2182728 RepID=A0A5N5JMP5_9ROSI|nr:hypothetical protein DKX38_024950 [Salix brachista]